MDKERIKMAIAQASGSDWSLNYGDSLNSNRDAGGPAAAAADPRHDIF